MNYTKVLDFWFSDESEKKWFIRNEEFDADIRRIFGRVWESACRGELFTWRESIRGRLAEIIVLDQFSRNLHRQSRKAWEQDVMALLLSQEALKIENWELLLLNEKGFLLMPWMHSESTLIHDSAKELFSRLPGSSFESSEHQHSKIISRFGRYPHRNELLGRQSSVEEVAFLNKNRASFF